MRRDAGGLQAGRGWVGASCAALVALCVLPPGARADDLAPNELPFGPHLLNPGRVPSGGALLISLDTSGGFTVIVSPVDEAAREIPGKLDISDYQVTWIADEPLPVGEYWVQVGPMPA